MEFENWIYWAPAALGIVTVSYKLISTYWLNHTANHWPAADGTIGTGYAKYVDRDAGGEGWTAEMRYSFSVGSDYYGGYFTKSADNEDEATEFARKLEGSTVIVRYKPSDPDTSCVEAASIEAILSDSLSPPPTRTGI